MQSNAVRDCRWSAQVLTPSPLNRVLTMSSWLSENSRPVGVHSMTKRGALPCAGVAESMHDSVLQISAGTKRDVAADLRRNAVSLAGLGGPAPTFCFQSTILLGDTRLWLCRAWTCVLSVASLISTCATMDSSRSTRSARSTRIHAVGQDLIKLFLDAWCGCVLTSWLPATATVLAASWHAVPADRV